MKTSEEKQAEKLQAAQKMHAFNIQAKKKNFDFSLCSNKMKAIMAAFGGGAVPDAAGGAGGLAAPPAPPLLLYAPLPLRGECRRG